MLTAVMLIMLRIYCENFNNDINIITTIKNNNRNDKNHFE